MDTPRNPLSLVPNDPSRPLQFFESFPEPTQFLDRNGQILWMNASARQLLETGDLAQLNQKHWATHWEEERPARAAFDDVLTGKTTRFKVGYRSPGGKEYWLELTLAPLSDSSDAAIYVLCRDRTADRQREEEVARLEAFVSCTSDGVIGFDSTGTILFWNEGAERIFGYSREEALGQKYTLFSSPEMRADQERTREELNAGNHRRSDTKRLRKDGTEVDVSVTTSPLFRKGERIPGGVLLVHEITERVQATEALQRQKELTELAMRQMQLALEAAQMGTFVSDLVTGEIALSESTRSLFQLPPEVDIKMRQSIYEYCHPDDHASILGAIEQSRETGRDFVVEYRAVLPTGGIRWLSARGRVERDTENRPQRVVGVIWDIDRRKKEAVEIERLAAFVSCTGDAIIGFDREGLITHWNLGAEQMFGYAPEEAIGKSYTLIGTSDVHAFQHRVFSETIKGDTHRWYETRRRCKDGRVLDVSVTTSPLLIEGEIVGLVGIVRDISEKVRVARQLEEVNARLQATAEEKRQFVNMVLHDLRHPLTTVKTLLYLLRHDAGTPREESLDVIEGRIAALNQLLDELTEYHRIEAGKGSNTLERVRVKDLLGECVANFTPALVGGSVEIHCDVSPDLDFVVTDSSKLTHIALNLLSNALKFTPQGRIDVRGERAGDDHWILVVEDTGFGMRAEMQVHIFEEFYQGVATGRRKEGFGLGLSIVKQLCEALQGTLEFSSHPEQGTRFAIRFPQALT